MEELLIMYDQSSHVFTLQTLGYGLYMPFVFFWLSFFFLSPTMNTNICILILKHFVALHFDTHAERPVGLLYLLHKSEKYIKQLLHFLTLKIHLRGSAFTVVAFSTDFLELVLVFRFLLQKSNFQLFDLILRKGKVGHYKEFTQIISSLFFKNAVHIPF